MNATDATSRDAYHAFARWLDGDANERAALLERLRVDQTDVHRRVIELIRADAEAARAKFMTGDAMADAGSDRAPDIGVDRSGQRVGSWELEKSLGAGGMGQVWLARRGDGLHGGRAAIKMLRVVTSDARANERFAQEGRILARLVHANIAMLLDAGVMADGQRYLVLEYVDGIRIDAWCDEHRLDVPARLALFLQVCAAVANAHANLIVHRDLKPSNILVMKDGTAKLLDFGIAKLIQSDTETTSPLTGEAGSAMTPGYAAPEQISGEAIGTATDVYALGVVLFRLLSGVGPYGRDSLTPLQIARAVMESEPGRLSDAAALPGSAQCAALRSTTSDRLRRSLRGDLDTIAMRALKKNPAERYASVTAMADDIRRHLDNRPIAARADSRGYRARKFVRRHWFGVSAAALIVLAVAGGVVGISMKQREAEHEAQRAIAVKRFLLDMFEQARTSVQSGGLQVREATVNDMLTAGADRVETEFASQPDIRDEIFQVMSSLYSDAFDPKQSIALAHRRLVAAQTAFGDSDVRTAAADIGLANSLLTAGEETEAKPLLAHAQGLLDAAGDRTSLTRARLLRWQGILVLVDGTKPPWQEHPLRQSIDILRSRYSGEDELLEALVTLPSEACRYHRIDEAIAAAEELHQRALARYGDDNLFVDSATLIRGQLLAAGHRPAEALPMLEKALEGFRRHAGEKNQNVLLTQLDLLETYWTLGRHDEANRLLASAAEAAERDHAGEPQVVSMMKITREHMAKLQAGQTLSPCGS